MSVLVDVLGVSVLNLPGRGDSSGKLGKKTAPHWHPAQYSVPSFVFSKLRITEYLRHVALTSISSDACFFTAKASYGKVDTIDGATSIR